MKLASDKPPEAVLEGIIFQIFLGQHTPRPPRLCHATTLTLQKMAAITVTI